MIKILHFTTDSMISGAEKLLIGIAKEFNRQKFELFFCTLKPRGDLHVELERLGQKTFSLDCASIFDLPKSGFKLLKLLRDYKIDILHTHLFHASVFGQFMAIFQRRSVPIMTRHYSDLLYIYGNCFQRFLDRAASRSAKHIISISEGVKRVLVDFDGIEEDKITVIYNGIDINGYTPDKENVSRIRESFRLNNTKVIGSIGALHPRKGHKYLIEAADLICGKRSDVKFLIIGDGLLRNSLSSLRDSLKLQEKVIFSGYRRDIKDLLSVIDIFVQPSIEEGFGLTIIEAMFNNKPVVATKVGGIPEIIEDRKTGLLVESKNASAIANAIEFYLDNSVITQNVIKESSRAVKEKFNLPQMVRKYEELYGRLLK